MAKYLPTTKKNKKSKVITPKSSIAPVNQAIQAANTAQRCNTLSDAERAKIEANILDQLGGVTRHISMEDAMKSTAKIRYVMGENGVLEVRENEIGTFSVKANRVLGGEKLQEGFQMKLPKIPYNLFLTTLAFFKDVASKMQNSEAMVQIFWDREKQEYFLFVPLQKVSGSSIEYTRDKDLESKHILVMDLHSHNTMSAFWSGTDTADEKETRFFGVIGQIDKVEPQMKFRLCCGGGSIDNLDIWKIFETPYPEIAYPEEWMSRLTKSYVLNNVQCYGKSYGGATGKNGAAVAPSYRTSDYDYYWHEDNYYKHDNYGNNTSNGKVSTPDKADAEFGPDPTITPASVLDYIIDFWDEQQVAEFLMKLAVEGYDDLMMTCAELNKDDLAKEYPGLNTTK